MKNMTMKQGMLFISLPHPLKEMAGAYSVNTPFCHSTITASIELGHLSFQIITMLITTFPSFSFRTGRPLSFFIDILYGWLSYIYVTMKFQSCLKLNLISFSYRFSDFLKTFKTCQTFGLTERYIMPDRVIFCQTSSCSV